MRPATRRTTCWASPWIPTSTSASTRRRPATSARAAVRAGPAPAVWSRPIAMADVLELETHAWPGAYGEEAQPRVGFFTDTSVCIGCKACEVACKEWNHVPEDGLEFTGMSYDNTQGLGADTWRHVAFIEQHTPVADERSGQHDEMRWLMSSDVCKHCTHAACLDVCPTGSLFRTEFGTVVVQQDICNG